MNENGKWGHLVRVEATGETDVLGMPEYEIQIYNPKSWNIDDGWYPLRKLRGPLFTVDINARAICELLDQVSTTDAEDG